MRNENFFKNRKILNPVYKWYNQLDEYIHNFFVAF